MMEEEDDDEDEHEHEKHRKIANPIPKQGHIYNSIDIDMDIDRCTDQRSETHTHPKEWLIFGNRDEIIGFFLGGREGQPPSETTHLSVKKKPQFILWISIPNFCPPASSFVQYWFYYHLFI
ncbi:unnamed protein product [Camellia sinensis]